MRDSILEVTFRKHIGRILSVEEVDVIQKHGSHTNNEKKLIKDTHVESTEERRNAAPGLLLAKLDRSGN